MDFKVRFLKNVIENGWKDALTCFNLLLYWKEKAIKYTTKISLIFDTRRIENILFSNLCWNVIANSIMPQEEQTSIAQKLSKWSILSKPQ